MFSMNVSMQLPYPVFCVNIEFLGLSLWIKDKLENTYKWAGDDDLQCCQLCDEPSEDLFSIRCGHYFCETCLEDDEKAVDEEGKPTDVSLPLPSCCLCSLR